MTIALLYWTRWDDVQLFLGMFFLVAFLWLPLVFVAYAWGRRQFSLRVILIAIATEGVSLAVTVKAYEFVFVSLWTREQ